MAAHIFNCLFQRIVESPLIVDGRIKVFAVFDFPIFFHNQRLTAPIHIEKRTLILCYLTHKIQPGSEKTGSDSIRFRLITDGKFLRSFHLREVRRHKERHQRVVFHTYNIRNVIIRNIFAGLHRLDKCGHFLSQFRRNRGVIHDNTIIRIGISVPDK